TEMFSRVMPPFPSDPPPDYPGTARRPLPASASPVSCPARFGAATFCTTCGTPGRWESFCAHPQGRRRSPASFACTDLCREVWESVWTSSTLPFLLRLPVLAWLWRILPEPSKLSPRLVLSQILRERAAAFVLRSRARFARRQKCDEVSQDQFRFS